MATGITSRFGGRRSRRLLWSGALVSAMVLTTVGCSSTGSPSDATQTSTPSSPATGSSPAAGGSGAPAEGAFVLDGETIADAALYQAAQDEGSFVIYSGKSEDSTRAILELFKTATGIDYELVRLGSTELFERAMSEFGANALTADAILMTDEILTKQMQTAGMFAPHTIPAEFDLAPEYIDPQSEYFTTFIAVTGFAYNSEVIPPEDAPHAWKDLTDPKYQGLIGMASINNGGNAAARDLWLYDTYGEQYWRDLAANQPLILGSQGSVIDSVASGETGIGIAVPALLAQAAESGAPLTVVPPSDGWTGFPATMSVVSSAAHPNAAGVFINWVLSREGQSQIAEAIGDYPVRTDARPPMSGGVALPSVDEVPINMVDPAKMLDQAYREQMAALWNSIFNYVPEGG